MSIYESKLGSILLKENGLDFGLAAGNDLSLMPTGEPDIFNSLTFNKMLSFLQKLLFTSILFPNR